MENEENCDFYLINSGPLNLANSTNIPVALNENPIALLESITKGDDGESNLSNDATDQRIDSDDYFLNEISSQYIQGVISFDLYKDILSKIRFKKENAKNSKNVLEEGTFDEDSEEESDEDYKPASEAESDENMSDENELSESNIQKYQKSKRENRRKTRLPKHLQGLMGTANLSWVSGNKIEAENICNQIIQAAPSAHEPYSLLSLIYEEGGLFEKSNQYALIAAHLDCSNSPDAWIKLAENAKKDEKYTIATDYYRKATAIYRKYLLQKKLLEDNIIKQYIDTHNESAILHEKCGEIRKASRDYQSILNLITHQRKYKDSIVTDYRPIFINTTQVLAKLHHSANNFKEAHACLKVVFDRYDMKTIDTGLLNLFVDIQLNQSYYLEALQLLGQFCGIDWTLPANTSQSDQLSDYHGVPISTMIPSNFPIDLQAKLVICLIHLHKNPHYRPGFNFSVPFYQKLLQYLENSLLEVETNAFGDLFIDITEAYRDCLGGKKQLESDLNGEHTFISYARVLPFFHKILGLNAGDGISVARATTYTNVPGIWLAYGETLETLAQPQLAVRALEKVVELAPHHQLSQFKLERIKNEKKVSFNGLPALVSGMEFQPLTNAQSKVDGAGTKEEKSKNFVHESAPYPAPPITLTMLTNILKDVTACQECLDQCLQYYEVFRVNLEPGPKKSAARVNFLSLGLSIFFSLASENLSIPKAKTFYKALALTVVREAELKLGINKDPSTIMDDDDDASNIKALPPGIRGKLDRLFQLLSAELRPKDADSPHSVESRPKVTDDQLFLYACAMGCLGQFSIPKVRENMRYLTLSAAFCARRWRYALLCVKCSISVLTKADWMSGQRFAKSPVTPSASVKVSSMIRSLGVLVACVQQLQTRQLASSLSDSDYLSCSVVGIPRGAHASIARKLCFFLLNQLRLYPSTQLSSAPHALAEREELGFLLSWTYACLSHGIASYGVACFEYRRALAFLSESPCPPRQLRYVHLKPLVLLSMATAMLELACGPKMFWLGPYPAQATKLKDSSNVCHSMIPLSYAFVCLSAYASLRGPCQEVFYNLGRAYHQIDMLSQAVEHYNAALTYPPPDICSDPSVNSRFDLTPRIAYNLALIYKSIGSIKMASYVTQKYLTIR